MVVCVVLCCVGYVFNRDALRSIASLTQSPYAPMHLNEDTTVGVWAHLLRASVHLVDDWRFYPADGAWAECRSEQYVWHYSTPQDANARAAMNEAVERTHKSMADNLLRCALICTCK